MELIEPLTVFFVEISGGARDDGAQRAPVDPIQSCLVRAEKVVTSHGGEIVGRAGFGLMCTLPDARRAVSLGLTVQDEIEAERRAMECGDDVGVRVGFHHGPVVLDQSRVFGETVYTAKRLVDLARPGQVLGSHDAHKAAGEIPGVDWCFADQILLEGMDRPLVIFDVARSSDTSPTSDVSEDSDRAGLFGWCSLRHGGQTYILDSARPVLTIGRQENCHLPILQSCVSRDHGRLEFRNGRVMFVDHSTNGTILEESGAEKPELVHRRRRWLGEQGLLCFGSSRDDSGALTLEYRCQTSSAPIERRAPRTITVLPESVLAAG